MTTKNKGEKKFNKAITDARNLVENLRGVRLDIVKVRQNKAKIFRAEIRVNNVRYSLGYYENPMDGAKAYNKKAKSLLGSEKKAKAMGRWNVIS